MNREEYIATVKFELGFLSEEEREKAVKYFESYFLSAENAEAVYECLGDPKTAAKNYCKTLLNAKKSKRIELPEWVKALAVILAAPELIMLALVLAAAAVGLAFAAMIFFIAIAAVCVFLWFDGMTLILDAVGRHIILADKLVQFGTGFLMFAAGLILTYLVLKWYSRMFPRILTFIADKTARIRR